MCLPDPPSKVGVSPFLAQLEPQKPPYVSHFWPPWGGSPIRPSLSFQSLGLKTHQDSPKTPHRPAKGAPRTSKTPQRCPKDPPKGYPEANFCFRVFLAPSGSKNLLPEPKTHQRYVTKGASRAAKSLRGPEPKYHKKFFVVFWPRFACQTLWARIQNTTKTSLLYFGSRFAC